MSSKVHLWFHFIKEKNRASFALFELGWPCPLLPRGIRSMEALAEMRHCTQSSCSMGITMEDLTWHPWDLGGHSATGHPKDLEWSFLLFLTGEAKRRKRFIEFAWIPAASMAWGIEYGLFAAWLLKTGHWSRSVWKSGIIRIFQNHISWLPVLLQQVIVGMKTSPETFAPLKTRLQERIICQPPKKAMSCT